MNGTNISLTANEISDLIVSRFMEQVMHPETKLRPIYILGHAGVGKSQIVRQASKRAEEKIREFTKDKGVNTNCKTSALVFMEPPDFLGLCHITVDPKDKEEMTVFARPSVLPKDGYGIIFFDEANRANKEIKSGLLTLIEDREINGHKLGTNWLVVLAGNPTGDRYQNVSEFDPALLDRVCPVWFKGEAKETIKYLKGKYQSHPLVDFLDENPVYIDFEAKSRNTPRGLEYAIRATRNIPYDKWDRTNDQLINALGCELGLESTTYILSRISQKIKDLTVEEVLSDKEKTVKFLTMHKENTDLISTVEKRVREDIFKNLKTYSRQKEIDGIPLYPEKQTENLIAFMENLPPENFLTMLRAIDDDGTFDYNLEYVFGTNFTKKSDKLKQFVIKLYESSNDKDEAKSP
jgi:AAA domain (dynein-related subfamily)